MSKSIFGIVLWAIVNCVLAANEPVPIYQVINTQGDFIQVSLTHEIFRYSAQPNLGNLVVLDAEKNPLPFRILAATPQTQIAEPKITTTSLPFFPVAVDATPDTLRKLHTQAVKVKGDNLQITTSDKTLDNKTPEFYLVDLTTLDQSVTSMVIEWAANPGTEYLEVQLEGARNLQDWVSLASATLVQITQQGQSLKRNRIDFSMAKKEYEFLRLRIIRGADNLEITRISAEEKIGGPATSITAKESWRLTGQPAKDQNGVYVDTPHSKTYPVAAWEFIRNEHTPVENLAIDLGATSYADAINIFSRAAENQAWQLRYQGIVFNTQIGNQWQQSDPISIYQNSDIFWRIELNEAMRSKANPQLVLSWLPLELQLIGNSKPPFFLAINNDNNSSYYRNQVFNQITSATKPEWTRASLQILQVDPSTLNTPNVINWKQWIFWCVLIVAVLTLLVFALRLFKQMNTTAER